MMIRLIDRRTRRHPIRLRTSQTRATSLIIIDLHQHLYRARRSMKHSLKMGRSGLLCVPCSPVDVFLNGWNTSSDIFGRIPWNDRSPVRNAISVFRGVITSTSICGLTKGRHPVVVERVVGLERLEIGSMVGGMVEKIAVGLKVRMTFRPSLLTGLQWRLLRVSLTSI